MSEERDQGEGKVESIILDAREVDLASLQTDFGIGNTHHLKGHYEIPETERVESYEGGISPEEHKRISKMLSRKGVVGVSVTYNFYLEKSEKLLEED